jgi:thiol:disulfide interchange protein DsbD
VISIWLALAFTLAAQTPAKKGTETAHLVVTTSVAADSAAAGRKVSLHVEVAPKPLMHVYAPGQEGYLTIVLTLDADASFEAAKAKYPAGQKLFMPLLNETQLVYAKPFRITQDVTFRAGLAPGPRPIKGTLRYQACDDKVCYRPVTVPLTWTIELDALRSRQPGDAEDD